MKVCIVLLLAGLASGFSSLVQAQETPPPAYQVAALYSDIPSTVLYAIALQESGRSVHGRLRPWPWTLNVAGKPFYFETNQSACSHLHQALKSTPAKRIDIGLGQVNYGYHGDRVEKPCDLLNPYINLAIAADILSEQHQDGQDWLITMGKYHSPANGAAAKRYRISVQHHFNRVQGSRNASSSNILVSLP